MRLDLLPMEARDCPAVWYGGGFFYAGRFVEPFPDWHGTLNTLDTGTAVYVAPGTGGGPRVAVFDLATGQRARPDYFAADPEDRNGVVFVGVDLGLSPKSLYEPLTAGNPGGFPVFIDFEAGVDHLAFHAAADLLTPAGISLTTVRPDLPPGSYGQVVVAPLGWTDGAGVTTQDWRQTPDWVPRAVYVDGSLAGPWLGKVIAHEIGHAVAALPHRTDGSVMSEGYRPGMRWADSDLRAMTAAVEAL